MKFSKVFLFRRFDGTGYRNGMQMWAEKPHNRFQSEGTAVASGNSSIMKKLNIDTENFQKPAILR
jgi:hypothetical protein